MEIGRQFLFRQALFRQALFRQALSDMQYIPTFLKSNDVKVCRRLQSASTSTLIVPSTRRSTLGDRAFPVAAARAWNARAAFAGWSNDDSSGCYDDSV